MTTPRGRVSVRVVSFIALARISRSGLNSSDQWKGAEVTEIQARTEKSGKKLAGKKKLMDWWKRFVDVDCVKRAKLCFHAYHLRPYLLSKLVVEK